MAATAKSAFLQKFQSKISVVGKDGSHAKVGEVGTFLPPRCSCDPALTLPALGKAIPVGFDWHAFFLPPSCNSMG